MATMPAAGDRRRSRHTGLAKAVPGAVTAALAVALLALASVAHAAPVHPRLPDLDLDGSGKTMTPKEFNRACGVAVDSEGNVYVASAGNGTIDVFDDEHQYLATISNANEPCGLAINTKGELYVSETGTENVVKYVPDAFPFTGAPSYEPPVAIDSSGEAKGIAVDPFDDRLYVAKGDHVASYNPDGSPGIDEVQRILIDASAGTFTLTFEGQTTGPIKFDAPASNPGGEIDSVQEALENLSTIGAGNVSVSSGQQYAVRFVGDLAKTDVSMLSADKSGLTNGPFNASALVFTQVQGFSGRIGEGTLSGATGVAAYTFSGTADRADRYVFVADPAAASADRIHILSGGALHTLKPRRTIETFDHDANPATPPLGLQFGAEGAHLAADRGTCPPSGGACTAGHFFLYDDGQRALLEFGASGELLTSVSHPQLTDAEPTASAVDRSEGPQNGTLYVSSGAGPGAEVLAFGSLPPPSRPPRPDLSFQLDGACAIAVDGHGNRYVGANASVSVYDETGSLLTSIVAPGSPCDIAVDSTGNVYALRQETAASGDEKVVYFKPKEFPPESGTEYTGPITVATAANLGKELRGIGLDPADDRLFVNAADRTIEFGSAAEGSGVVNPNFVANLNFREDIAVHGPSGSVYIAIGNGGVAVVDESGSERLGTISGMGSPKGPGGFAEIAVDQENGHALVFAQHRAAVEEYERSGAFVAQYGNFTTAGTLSSGIALDGSGGANDGNLYFAFDDPAPDIPAVSAFGPLTYGEPPIAVTGRATEVDGEEAVLNGTVDPRGVALEECRFQYTDESDFQANGFSTPHSAPCEPDLAAIGSGDGPVAVRARVSGLDLDERHVFRLLAANEFGPSEGVESLFGPPIATPRSAQPIAYTEAMLRATVDPSGLATSYRFEYGTSDGYGQSTAVRELGPDAGPTAVEIPIFALEEGTTYHFRFIAENEAKTVTGSNQTFVTLQREDDLACPNAVFRTGRSSALPDCRAYELVTPADTRGATPYAATAPVGSMFNNWLVNPRGQAAGGRVTYFLDGTLPGFEGTGLLDGYRAVRAEGGHPSAGWSTALIGPSFSQARGSNPSQHGASADQLYSVWNISGSQAFDGSLGAGVYLRTPDGFEPLGMGSQGVDSNASSRFVSPGGAHVIFQSAAALEPAAAPTGTTAVYDRSHSGATRVVSLRPDGSSFAGGEHASFVGATEDGSTIAFEVDGALYVRRANTETVKVVDAPYTFAGLSEDGERIFYTDSANGGAPGNLFAFELDSQSALPIAADSVFVNVPSDGSHVYFTSTAALTGPEENGSGETAQAGSDNLYLWDGNGTSFVAILDARDLVAIGSGLISLRRWTDAVSAEPAGQTGRAQSPTRSTPDGKVLVFASHADLTSYESDGRTQIYRYDSGAGSMLCVSCDPTGAPAVTDATLQSVPGGISTVAATSVIPNVTDDGQAVFFQSEAPLLPGDANDVQDVYRWKAQGAGGCRRAGGCLALISSGQSETPNFLYGMTPDGRDVFFSTTEKLVGADITGSPSIYDARVDGGIPDPPIPAPCQGDACRGEATPVPKLAQPGAETAAAATKPKARRCPKGKRRVARRGKTRCVVRKSQKRKRAARHQRTRRAGR